MTAFPVSRNNINGHESNPLLQQRVKGEGLYALPLPSDKHRPHPRALFWGFSGSRCVRAPLSFSRQLIDRAKNIAAV